jgi:aspartate/methionine/tyrosine aminotransferase
VILYAYLALVEEGDVVAYPDPGFPIFESLVDALGARRAPYRPGTGTRERPDLGGIAEALARRPRLLVLNSPGNPTGVVHRPEEVAEVARLARDTDAWVLSDEIYGRMRFGQPHVSVAAEDGMAERTVILDGFSKTYAMTGWRLGYAVCPRPLSPLFEKLVTNSTSCAVHFAQHAALAALEGPTTHLEEMREAVRLRRDALVEGLRSVPGIEVDAPEGAFFVFADVTGTGIPARTLAERLLEEAGVAVVEGPAFGAGGEGHVRLSLSADVARIREAVERVRRLLHP